MSVRPLGVFPLALCFVLSACGSGMPEGPAAAKDHTSSALFGRDDQGFSCTDCNHFLDPGLRAACLTCCKDPTKAFQGCVRGTLFDPLTCSCIAPSACALPSAQCGHQPVCCPVGGECCHAGTAPLAVDFCLLPGSVLPTSLLSFATCTALCPTGETACGTTCHNLQTEVTNCGACGHACGTGQICTAGTCCTPQTVCLPGQCGVIPNGCGGALDCGNPCTGPGQTCGGGGVPNRCGCTPTICAAQACSTRAASIQIFDQSMAGCGAPGSPPAIAYADRASLCASGCHACTAAEWNEHRGAAAPTSNYWTADLLNFVGGSTNNCSVSTTAGSNPCSGGAMLVCPNGSSCQITGCGLNTTVPQFFGGCSLSSGSSSFGFAQGTLCCCPCSTGC